MVGESSSPKGVFFLLLHPSALPGVGMYMLPEVVCALEKADSRKKVRNKQQINSSKYSAEFK